LAQAVGPGSGWRFDTPPATRPADQRLARQRLARCRTPLPRPWSSPVS